MSDIIFGLVVCRLVFGFSEERHYQYKVKIRATLHKKLVSVNNSTIATVVGGFV